MKIITLIPSYRIKQEICERLSTLYDMVQSDRLDAVIKIDDLIRAEAKGERLHDWGYNYAVCAYGHGKEGERANIGWRKYKELKSLRLFFMKKSTLQREMREFERLYGSINFWREKAAESPKLEKYICVLEELEEEKSKTL
ncbi:hypothetical protein HYU07_01735 [Candidatus Woesearchaeota archaeon]|nr:hypothetical protein [Candidatus Woesearchaeota archaeon]